MPTASSEWIDVAQVDPCSEFVWAESNELADLEERDSALVNEATYKAFRHAQQFGHPGDVSEAVGSCVPTRVRSHQLSVCHIVAFPGSLVAELHW